MILVVGATGQLGSLMVEALRQQDRPVRAVVHGSAARSSRRRTSSLPALR